MFINKNYLQRKNISSKDKFYYLIKNINNNNLLDEEFIHFINLIISQNLFNNKNYLLIKNIKKYYFLNMLITQYYLSKNKNYYIRLIIKYIEVKFILQ